MTVSLLASFLGLYVLLSRLAPLLRDEILKFLGKKNLPQKFEWPLGGLRPLASIIIPARNEEANLPRLFKSLEACSWSPLEILLVDDQSTDRTREIADEFARKHPNFNFQVVSGQPRPDDWTGKNWACQQGFLKAKGDYLLFTDADTWHEPLGLELAISKMEAQGIGLLSATPFHISETFWEKLLGPFHAFLLVTTGAFLRPRISRVFAIGQFLLFRRDWYLLQDGHHAVRGFLGEDLELASICLKQGGRYDVEFLDPLFRVRMYLNFRDFVFGWRRIFRLGFKHSSVWAPFEIYFVIAALTSSFQFFSGSLATALILVLSLFSLYIVQRRIGEFSVFGILLYPLSLLLFTFISCLAVFDLISQKRYTWRGREYGTSAD